MPVAIVAPQPAMEAGSAPESSNALLPFTMPQENARQSLALVTPSLAPREAATSPQPLEITKASLPIANPNALLVSVPGQQPLPPPDALGNEQTVPTTTHIAISPPSTPKAAATSRTPTTGVRLNKFVRRLHDMLQAEQNSGIVEWRRGLLVLHSTDAFAKTILPRYFNTRNFKTFRRQLNYYGFVHVRSFSTTGSSTTALWVNRDLAKRGTADISSVLMLKRVEPCETAKTAEGRRVRKELAVSTVEEDIGVSAKSLQLEQIRSMAMRKGEGDDSASMDSSSEKGTFSNNKIPLVVHCHGANSTTTTTIEGSSDWFTSATDSSSGAESDDDAANLLLMLSKATSVSL